MASAPPKSFWHRLVHDLPGAIASFITFITVAVGFVQLWESRPDLVARVVMVSLAGLAMLGSVYLWRRGPQRWRVFGLAGLVVLPLVVIGAALLAGRGLPSASNPAPRPPASSPRSAEAATRLGPLDAAIQANPQSADAYANRGTAYYELKMTAEAVRDLEQALKLNPAHFGAYFMLGAVHFYQTGDMERAIESFSQAIALQPGNANVYSGRGEAYMRKGDAQKAIADFSMHIKLVGDIQAKPNVASVYLARAQAYERVGDTPNAMADYRAIVAAAQDEAFRNTAQARLKALGGE